jgi:hypothetical protein
MISNRGRIGKAQAEGKRRWRAALQGGLTAAWLVREAPWSAERQFRFGRKESGAGAPRSKAACQPRGLCAKRRGKRRWRAALQSGVAAAWRVREAPWSAERQFRFGWMESGAGAPHSKAACRPRGLEDKWPPFWANFGPRFIL